MEAGRGLVVFSGFLTLGCHRSEASYARLLGRYFSNPRQQVAFEWLVLDSLLLCRLDPGLAVRKGRGLARLRRLQQALSLIVPDAEADSHFNLDGSEAVSLPVCKRAGKEDP